MTHFLNVRIMTIKEVDLLYKQALNENWDPGIYDCHSYFKASPDGFYVGTLDDEPMSFVSIVQYEKHFAFFGNYIVLPKFRNKGYGYALVKNVASRLENRISALDAVVTQIKTYEKMDFVSDSYNIRYKGIAKKTDCNNDYIKNINEIDFNKLIEYDYRHFLANRQDFLIEWLHHPHAQSLVYYKKNKICGYSVIRKTASGYRIAPLFAENKDIAKELIKASLNNIAGRNFTINMPSKNENIDDIISTFQLEPVFKTMRMYRNGKLDLPCNNIYSITSFELG